MERGLYAAASAMLAQQVMQDTLADNIANANTVGYKATNHTFHTLQTMALERHVSGQGSGGNIGELGLGVTPDRSYIDWQSGSISETHNPLDASLGPGQFFAIQSAGGERYTRAGNFQVDGTGNLRTAAGQPVLDVNGAPIRIQGGTPEFDGRGNVLVNKQRVAQLKIIQAGPNALNREGDTTFRAASPASVTVAPFPQVRPGTLEQSNVNGVRGMVEMVAISRSFEMAHRALTTQDELLRHAAAEVGKI